MEKENHLTCPLDLAGTKREKAIMKTKKKKSSKLHRHVQQSYGMTAIIWNIPCAFNISKHFITQDSY